MKRGPVAAGADARFRRLGDEIPPHFPPPPGLSFVGIRIAGGLAYLSGHGPNFRKPPPQFDYVGKVGADLTPEQGAAAARLCGLNLLVTLREAIGSLDRVAQILTLDCAVASASGFTGQSAVANGCSDLLVEIFEEAGAPARMATGMAELPFGMAVEATLTAQLKSD